jgi:hypothetical protein
MPAQQLQDASLSTLGDLSAVVAVSCGKSTIDKEINKTLEHGLLN